MRLHINALTLEGWGYNYKACLRRLDYMHLYIELVSDGIAIFSRNYAKIAKKLNLLNRQDAKNAKNS